MKYYEAVKIWNKGNTGAYCNPKKGSKEYDEVKKIMMQEKATTTLTGAVKGMKARKAMASAKAAKAPPPAPAKKIDDNRLHNLPEDLQKKIMGIAKKKDIDSEGWMERTMTMEDFKNTFYYQGIEGFKKNWFSILPKGFKKQNIDSIDDIPNDTIIPYKWTNDKMSKIPEIVNALVKERAAIKRRLKTAEEKKNFDANSFQGAIVFLNKGTTTMFHNASPNEVVYKNMKNLTLNYDETIQGTRTAKLDDETAALYNQNPAPATRRPVRLSDIFQTQ